MLPQAIPMAADLQRVSLELPLAKERTRHADGFERRAALAQRNHGGVVCQHRRAERSTSNAREFRVREDLGVVRGQRLARGQGPLELRLFEERRDVAHQVPACRLLDLPGHRREPAVAVDERERAVAVVVAAHAAALVLVLAPGRLGHHLTVRVDVVERHLEVLSHGFTQLGAIEPRRDRQQRAIDHRRVHRGALLGELAIRVDVHRLGQPLVDSRHVAPIRMQCVQARQRRRDDPSVIRRVHATGDQRLSGLDHEGVELTTEGTERRPRRAPHNRGGRGDRLQHERRVWRRVEVGRDQVDRPIVVLGPQQVSACTVQSLRDFARLVERGRRRSAGAHQRGDELRGASNRMDAEVVRDAAVPAMIATTLLSRQEGADPLVVVSEEVGEDRIDTGGGGTGSAIRRLALAPRVERGRQRAGHGGAEKGSTSQGHGRSTVS